MALEKLRIAIEEQGKKFGKPFAVMYNPNQMQMTRRGGKLSIPQPKCNDPNPSPNPAEQLVEDKEQRPTLTLSLFFDTTLEPTGSQDVQRHTQTIYNLTKTNGELKRPPLCRLYWGKGDDWFLQGFLSEVTKNLTKFLEDGTPVRATMNCTFIEWYPPEYEAKKQNVIDDPIRIVRRGETLSSIAAEEYSDPALWRLIADANKIYNPLAITPGQSLTVPPRP
ncbi:MAG: LysM peptidoglycan-binding domain-containing protein [Oscillatoria sp. SIO1A7]|nr:LysM peptidoglycan-binding domain-containing protein [Oscillatoria sp. SIO1A7]